METFNFLIIIFIFLILLFKFVNFGLKIIKKAQDKEDEKRKKQS